MSKPKKKKLIKEETTDAYSLLEEISKHGGYRIVKYEIDGEIHVFSVIYNGKKTK